jgi:ABC-type sugar transport system ATPase subunit
MGARCAGGRVGSVASVRLDTVTVRHGDVVALDAVDLDVAHGEFIGVIGMSGAGKTTLLRAVAGLDRITAGSLMMDDEDVTRHDPGRRDTAMVFQQPHLLPHRSVGRNVAFPLEVRRRTAEEIRARVDAEARALHIDGLLERSPSELSAGEMQLVQIARAMVRVPRVLLLDEPLARLDALTREHMRRELRVLQRGYGVTTFFTTNDPTEAMAMSDRLVVLDAGRAVQVGVPIDVYRQPNNVTAAQLVGPLRVSTVEVSADRHGFWLHDAEGVERAWRTSLGERVGGRVLRGVRPDGSRLLFDAASGDRLG